MDWFTKLDEPSIFIASPGDLASLRESLCQEIEALRSRLTGGVKPYAWEFEMSKTGFDHWRPLPTQIPLPSSRYCLALICIFGERIGTPISQAKDFPIEVIGDWGRGHAPESHLVYPWRERAEFEGGFALTGTVFEYFVAMAANERQGLPRKGAPPILLMCVGDAGKLEPSSYPAVGGGGLYLAGGAAARPKNHGKARPRRLAEGGARSKRALNEYNSQIRQLQNFLQYVRSRGRDCLFINSEKEALRETRAFLERVLGLSETRNGFKGLEFYDVKDESVFFGRGALINNALDKFGRLWAQGNRVPFLGLFGGSGVGKSSLLRAGLLARLLKETWRGDFDCAVVTAHEVAAGLEEAEPADTESASPLGVVYAKALSSINGGDALAETVAMSWGRGDDAAALAAAVGRLIEALDARRPNDAGAGPRRLVVGLDQFEHLIDYRAEREKRPRLEPLFRFFERAAESGRIGFIYTCQPNRRHLIEQDPILNSLAGRGDFVEVLFPAESVEEIVGGLFERARVRFQPEYVKAVCERILDFIGQAPAQLKSSLSAQASLLPLISLTLSRIYYEAARRIEGEPDSLAPEAVPPSSLPPRGTADGPEPGPTALGAEHAKLLDIKGAIAELAERALTEVRQMPGVEWTEDAVGVLLRRLVRIQTGEEERFHLPEGSLPARGVVRLLSQSLMRYRLLLPVAAERVRLTHEAVIYYWPLAEKWLEQDRALLRTAAILSARARSWEREGRPVAALEGVGQDVDELAGLLRCWPDVYGPNAGVKPREEDQLLCDYAFAAFEALMQPGRIARGRADEATGRSAESTHFLTAVSYGRAGLVKKYLNAAPNAAPAAIRQRTSDGANAAYCAASSDSVETLDTVLSYGAAPDLPNNEGWLPVHVAANWGRREILDRLVAAGARAAAANPTGMTAAHLAARNGDVTMLSHLLSRYSVNPDARTEEGWTPLHLACHFSDRDTVALLMATGKVNPASQTNEGWSPFHIACRYCERDVVALLLAHPLTNAGASAKHGWSPLHLAIAGKREGVVAEVFASERVGPQRAHARRGDRASHGPQLRDASPARSAAQPRRGERPESGRRQRRNPSPRGRD